MDLLFSILILLVTVPFWLVIAILIKLDSFGPVLYMAEVVGMGETHFHLLKFRSMHVVSDDAVQEREALANLMSGRPTFIDADGLPVFKTSLIEPARITRVGRWLRRTSLDELPQILNVLRGQMSLVGPRPALPFEAAHYDDRQRKRFQVPAGITGIYQISARGRVPVEEMVRIDLDYAERCSIWLDFWILLRTPAAMLRGI